jgi:hypothetical protein
LKKLACSAVFKTIGSSAPETAEGGSRSDELRGFIIGVNVCATNDDDTPLPVAE